MIHLYFALAFICLNIEVSKECALPFWWTQQYQFPPEFPIIGQPKTTYRYRSTFHRTDPNNYVHFQEFSEFTWWEHDTSRVRPQLSTEDIQGMTNVVFSKDGSINGISPGKTRQLLPNGIKGGIPREGSTNGKVSRTDTIKPPVSPETNSKVPKLEVTSDYSDTDNGIYFRGFVTKPARGETNDMVPRGSETNGMVPRGSETNGMVPTGSETNGMVPRGSETNGMVTKSSDTNGISNRDGETLFPGEDSNGIATESTSETTVAVSSTTTKAPSEREPLSPDRERNENEDFEVSKSENLEGNDLEAGGAAKSSSELKIKEPHARGKFFGSWFGTRTGNETEPCKVPETDIHSLRSMIEKMFSKPREHLMHPESKEKAREDILNKFRNYGLQVWTQNFTTPMMKNSNGTEESNEGVNLVGVIPGSQRGRLDDEIVLVGAHYDTVADSNGVDDNGSGLAVMLEIARAITEARCRLNHTLMFVAFDHEENGAMGSNYFVDNYLIPEELKRARAQFQGAFILDGIMNYNDVPNTQELPLDYTESLPGFQYFVNNTGNRGNFLAMISRNEMDNHLSKKLMDAWQDLGDHQYKLFNLAVDMGNTIPEPAIIQKHLNFLRSDHATFWYHNSSSHFPDSLNAVLLTDTGPFRGQMKECYHSKCDDLTVITPEKLQFAKKTADALTATLVELTSATATGSQLYARWSIFALHIAVLYYATKILRIQ